jgi:type I restriction enzyme M protein
MARTKSTSKNNRTSLKGEIKAICDIMRRSNCAGAMQYVPELTWLLFLHILDVREESEANIAAALGNTFVPSLSAPYRWKDWAKKNGEKREELVDGKLGGYFEFINGKDMPDGSKYGLLPHLKSLRDLPEATPRQKVISEILSGVERVRIDTEKNLLDILDKIDEVSGDSSDDTHIFTMSQIYEELLLKMGEKGNDGGQFFTPREIIRAMVKVVDPKPGETIYDPCCGTGGFLVQAYLYLLEAAQDKGAETIEFLKHSTFFGREKENLIYPITLANMVLHGIEQPSIWHGNTLTGNEVFGGLFSGAPNGFDIVLTNPPFGGKEGKEAQTNFAYKTGATQVLFLQHIIDSLKSGGRCGIVLDEGVLFRTNETAFVQTKRKLFDDCNVYCIISLPGGLFTAAGAGVKTNILFFEKGLRTEKVWYYDLSDIKVNKSTPFTIDKLDDFFSLLPTRADSERSWTVERQFLEDKDFDLKAVNPWKKTNDDESTLSELLTVIEDKSAAIVTAVEKLKALIGEVDE